MDDCMITPPEDLSQEEIDTVLGQLSHSSNPALVKKFRWFSYAVDNDPLITVDSVNGELQFEFKLGDGTQSQFSVSLNTDIEKFGVRHRNCEVIDARFNVSREMVTVRYSVGSIVDSPSGGTEDTYVTICFSPRTGERTNTCVTHTKVGNFEQSRSYALYSPDE